MSIDNKIEERLNYFENFSSVNGGWSKFSSKKAS